MNVRTVNPATEEILADYNFHTDHEVETRVEKAHAASLLWRATEFSDRRLVILKLADLLDQNRESLAQLITAEMGKLLKESLGEVDKCALGCRTMVQQFPEWRAHHEYSLPTGHLVTREPMGLLLGIMPWNFPLWQVIRFAVPAILCGNAILLKHAPNTWGSALALHDLMNQALPEGLYSDLRLEISKVDSLLADPRVRGVSLTGSRRAGASVGELAGRHLKKCVLELGGSDAYVILDDADLELAARACVTSRLINAGQSCVSAKRFVVTRKNHTAFVEAMVELMKTKSFGDPRSESSALGPLARADLRDQLADQWRASLKQGAREALEGGPAAGKGYFFSPSILIDVKPGMVAFDEELFGPVAAVIEARDEGEAIQLANHSRYGLGGALFSRDVERAAQLARQEIEAGMVFVNDFVKSDTLTPFGGVKDSGLGRELGRDGCFEFTNIKTVYLSKG